jgi:Rps23 Pro-64 3,4-dihydroxylase Tpa1-like proline 4-hydroxylase
MKMRYDSEIFILQSHNKNLQNKLVKLIAGQLDEDNLHPTSLNNDPVIIVKIMSEDSLFTEDDVQSKQSSHSKNS